ncbi:MAG TPA: HAD-IB family hydrolase [Puia sp.]|jgi:HAD superfamily hydrolase (TIGR01490 family)
MSRPIAFFDFDGTITTKDTLLEFIKFSKGTLPFYIGFALNSPWLIAYRLKFISNQKAKERILTWFFHNMPLSAFQRSCDEFAQTRIPALIRPKALHEIGLLKEKGIAVVIVSASPENWLHGWTENIEAQLLATKLETNQLKGDTRLTGKIRGFNCHGQEKVRRINEAFPASDYNILYAYGDTSGDKPMLALAAHPFFKPFRS